MGEGSIDRALEAAGREGLDAGDVDALASALYALADRWPIAFEGSLARGRRLAELIARLLGLPFATYRVTDQTSSLDVIGDPRNRQTIATVDFPRMLRQGGVFLVDVPCPDARTAKVLALFTSYLGAYDDDVLVLTGHFPDGFSRSPDFHLIFNLAEPTRLPSELASNLHFIWLEPDETEEADPVVTPPLEPGPGTVLVLMKFGVGPYEEWYEGVVRPVVEGRDQRRCIRLGGELNEWRTEMRYTLDRADAVLMDLSHDLTDGLSPHVIWELTQVYKTALKRHGEGRRLPRERMLCFARGLSHVQSRDPDGGDYVYTSDINPGWVPTVSRSLRVEDLLGMRVRRYDPDSKAGVRQFQDWLRSALDPWVQGVPAPLQDSELRRQAIDFGKTLGPCWDEADEASLRIDDTARGLSVQPTASMTLAFWARLTSRLDVEGCLTLLEVTGRCPEPVVNLCGGLLSTVSAVDTIYHPGYWTLARHVIEGSSLFRGHLLNVLNTETIHTSHYATNNFRDNAWRCFRGVSLSDHEEQIFAECVERESDPDIQITVGDVLVSMLPPEEQPDARVRLMKWMLRDLFAKGPESGQAPGAEG